MRSWDCFDTLIARRSGDGLDWSDANSFPIAENVRQVRPEDVIISDIPLPPEYVIALFRKVTGLKNRMVVTDNGKESGKVWKQFQGQIESHAGDAEHSDGKCRQYGIPWNKTDLHKETKPEQTFRLIGNASLAAVMREVRLSRFDENFRDLELFTCQYNLPFLYMATLELMKQPEAPTVLMSSRDCYLWCKLASTAIEVEYFHTSRLCRLKPTESCRRYVSAIPVDSLVVDLCGTGLSLSALPFQRKMIVVGYPGCSVPCMVSGTIRETANLAPHGMVVDVVDGLPIHDPKFELERQAWVMSSTIDAAVKCGLKFHGEPELKLTLDALNQNCGALDSMEDARKREAMSSYRAIADIPGVIA